MLMCVDFNPYLLERSWLYFTTCHTSDDASSQPVIGLGITPSADLPPCTDNRALAPLGPRAVK